ncbi:GrpE protein-like 1, mitochondrial, partial [Fragariocoptes setiger]
MALVSAQTFRLISKQLLRRTALRTASSESNQDKTAAQDAATDPLTRQVEELKIENAQLLEDIKAIDDKYKRALADMENQRQRYNRLIAETKEFAVHGFCKDLIEITDVMSMALQNIKPEEVGKDNYEGISMIDKRIVSIFKKHGLISLNPKGEKFDPNKHQAMFEIPDASKEPGTVGEVVKVGWQLHDRIVRPAMVGVWKRPEA